jgi:predicted transcriptional regulator
MSRKIEAEELLKHGLLPSEIASRMGISVASVVQYLRTRVGEGALRLSEIYFYLPPEKRELLKRASENSPDGLDVLRQKGLTREELDLYNDVHKRSAFAGDLYEHVSETELAIHDMVSRTLKQAFGETEEGYWRKGVPVQIRKKCQDRREEDEEPCDSPFQYTTLIELSQIIKKNWNLFQTKLPKGYSSDGARIAKDLSRLNWIRNAVMHPVKRRRWSEADFQFASKLRAAFQSYRAP